MNIKRFLSLSILATTCALAFGQLDAQTLKRDSGPAETPPASFRGNQYVDSKGCVYIRAGVDGNTTWVPRVSRARKVVCGATPSGGAAAGTAVAAATRPAAVAKPVEIGVNSTAATATPTPAAQAIRQTRPTVAQVLAPKPVRTVASKPAVRSTGSGPKVQRVNIPQPSGVRMPSRTMRTAKVATPQPRAVTPQVQAPARRVAVNPQRTTAGQTCRAGSSVSQRYIGGRGVAVRCGPQGGSLVTRAGDVKGTFRSASGQVLSAGSVSPNAVVVPRHVYDQQQAARITQPIPHGYRQAWTDDRLNPRRAHQTLNGKAATDMIWSQTVPRRLIMRQTGRDVTRAFPGLRYPYTSMAQQQAAMQQGVRVGTVVSSKGQTTQRTQRRQQQVVQKQTRVSTRASTPRKPAQAAGKRFVQVGTFGVASNAQTTAQRLQRMGLPVRIGKFMRGGKEMRIVLAGPFGSSAHVNGALNAVRNAGYRDAFARN